MRLKHNEIKEYLFSISEEVSTNNIKAPCILHLLWSIYDVNFKNAFPIENDESKHYFLHWALVNISNTGVFYGNEIKHTLYTLNHKIDAQVLRQKITPLQLMIFNQREDLKSVFPKVTGEDAPRFWAWWIEHGFKEYGFDSPFDSFDENLAIADIVDFFDSIKIYNYLNQCYLEKIYESLHVNFRRDNESLTPFMILLWKARGDLNRQFEDIYFSSKKDYVNWWSEHGSSCYEKVFNISYDNATITAKNAEVPLKVDKNVAIIGHATGVLGLGEDARLISKSLESVGIPNKLYSSNSNANFSKEDNVNNVGILGEYEKGYYVNLFPIPANDIIDILMRFGLEPFYGAKYNICVVQWELEYFPKEYEIIKYLMDRVCSISTFAADAIGRTLKENVSVIPLPFNTEIKPIPSVNKCSPYTFYFAFDGNSFISRKNPLSVITSFQNAFTSNENVELVIKVMNSTCGDLWNECLRKASIDKRITIIDKMLSKQDYMTLVENIDCVVSLHRSEGFGRIIAESMLLEKPVIVSDYSGNTDYNSDENSFLVQGEMVPLFEGDYHLYQGNNWFEPSVTDASEKMQFVYNNQEIAKEKAKLAREVILTNYNFMTCGSKIRKVIEEMIIDESGLFDSEFYSSKYDVSENQLVHYVESGASKFLDPSEGFSTSYYVSEYPDVIQTGMNPLAHYILHGKAEGRRCNRTVFVPDSSHVPRKNDGMIFISHDATKTGAPLVVLDLCKEYAKKGEEFVVVLMAGGELQADFEKLAPVINLDIPLFNKDVYVPIEVMTLFSDLASKGYNQCIANSVLSGFLHEFLSVNCINTTYLVHEMPELIDDFNFTEAANNIANSNCGLIFSTNLAGELFCRNYAKKQRGYEVFPQGVSNSMIFKGDIVEAKSDILTAIGCTNPNAKIVLAAGLAQDRKGTDLFIEVAEACCKERDDIEFIWLGNKDKKYTDWYDDIYPSLEHKEHLHFIDFISDPSKFFGVSDVFLLTSREDPLPGVGLISLKNKLPLVMFEGTGGIQEYITIDNGKLIDKFDTTQMANTVIQIIDNGLDIVSNTDINTNEEYFDKVMTTIGYESSTKVSVVVPNYNYEQYLPERLNSIINQKHKVNEIIFLDDCSTDDSVEVAKQILSSSGISYQIVENQVNTGVYRQWLRGLKLAKNDLVWIAEADDFADDDFLESLVFMFDTHEKLGLAYSQSTIVDESGKIVSENVRFHTDAIDEDKWNVSYVNEGSREIESALVYRNTIPNVSSCLINKNYLEGIDVELLKYKYCGDWYLYSYILNKSNIGFCHRSLNHFRKHSSNVTTTNTYRAEYLNEVLNIKNYIYSIATVSKRMHDKMKNIFETDFVNANPNKNDIKHNIDRELSDLEKQMTKTLSLVTFNKEFGGSEVMWYDLACSLESSSLSLSVLCPYGLLDSRKKHTLRSKGVEVLETNSLSVEDLASLCPTYVLFSIGDHNDGGEYFEYCKDNKIDYVIINQLVKEDMWITDSSQLKLIFDGYKNAKKTFFTCNNNIDIFNAKMGEKLTNSEVHFNPISIKRDDYVDYPEVVKDYHLAFPGRLLTIHKGQDLLLKVLSDKKWKDRNLVVNFYGIGPDELSLKALADEYNLSNVNFCGYLSDVRKIWEYNHAFILTSHMEGIPIVLLGAMFAGRTAIVTDVGGNKEMLKDNLTGFIAESPTVESIDAALERAWDMRGSWKVMGQNARKDVVSLYPANPIEYFKETLEKALKW
ncbi:glycosyltransferase [Enterovibrio sp. ZSDZ35]|uniref:Glycosyltransferase n=1 Tax=Enterovibrio qingdaonensis TaxID=2899818 RepID=A0ABT5QNA9_9GAMM|nr:glycosyltransferase [Enterovibrio sp. ZSDZ35]MDD1782473.1 glycosyltransferase [Enterovibrio sp. ZSDZ35]